MSRNKSQRQGRAVEQEFYKPFYERGARYSSPSKNRVQLLSTMYTRVLTEMCLGRYDWHNLPDSISQRFMELTLFRNGLVGIFHHKIDGGPSGEVGKIVAARAAPSGGYDMQDDPLGYTMTGPGMSGVRRAAGDVVPVWSNALRIPDWDIVNVFSYRLAHLDRTIEINTMNARRSKIIAFNDNSRLTAAALNAQLEDGEAAIPVNSSLGSLADMMTALDLGVEPRTLSELSILRNQEWNRCMGLLGINNSNQDKKERLVSDEVDANNDQVSTARESNLEARQLGAKLFNKRYPELVALNGPVSVTYHGGESDAGPMPMGSEEEELPYA